MKKLEPYEQRMVDEYTALKTRIDSLTSFLRNEDSRSDIGLDEFRLLIEQYCAMLEYADALKKRLELHSINVEAIKSMLKPCQTRTEGSNDGEHQPAGNR